MIFRFAGCELNTSQRALLRDGRPVAVEPQVLDLIAHLAANHERVVSKDELIDAVWQGRAISDSTLTSRVNAARRALGDDGRRQAVVATLQRRGFRLVAPVEREDDVVDANPAEATGDAGGSHRTRPVPSTVVQDIRFCRAGDGTMLAYAWSGAGFPLVKTGHILTHLEHDRASPVWAPTIQRLADGRRLLRYDSRGNGLSDWSPASLTFEDFVDDLQTVVTAAGIDRFDLFGLSQGAAVAIAYAARYPERVRRIVIAGGYARGRRRRGSADEAAKAEALLTLMRQGWGEPGSAFHRMFSALYLPVGTAEEAAWFADLQRLSTSPEAAARIRDACDRIDISGMLGRVRAPTLVMHAARDAVVPFAEGRLIAAGIPDARFMTLDSDNHVILPHEPAWAAMVEAIDAFLTEEEAADRPQ